MKKQSILSGIAGILLAVAFGSCVTNNNIVIKRGTGDSLGTVQASATVSEKRSTGETTGDTGKYGYIDKLSDAYTSALNTGAYKAKSNKSVPNGAANKAHANAVYDIIQQVYAKGGNGLTNVIANVDQNFDIQTGIDTATVIIKADAVKLDKKASR